MKHRSNKKSPNRPNDQPSQQRPTGPLPGRREGGPEDAPDEQQVSEGFQGPEETDASEQGEFDTETLRREDGEAENPEGAAGDLGERDGAPQNGKPQKTKKRKKQGYGYGYGREGYGYGGYGDGYNGALLTRADRFAEASQLFANLHRYELTLKKHWWVVLLCLVVALTPASWYVYRSKPSFQSTSKMWMSGKLNIKEGQLYNEELTSFMGTQVELMKSSSVYDRALAKVLKTYSNLTEVLTPAAVPGEGSRQSAFSLEVKEYPKTSVIELKAVGPEGDATRLFLDSVMEEYQGFRKEVRLQSSDTTLASITEQVSSLQLELKSQQEKLQKFLATNNVVFLQEQGSSAGSFVAKLNKQLATLTTEAQLLRLLTPEQLTQSSPKIKTGVNEEASIGDDSTRDLLMSLSGPQAEFFKATQQIQLLKARREELGQFLRPNHPKMLKFEEDIANQEQVVGVFKKQSLGQMENRRQAIELQIQSLESSAKEWEAKALDTSRRMAEYERIKQDVARTQGLYERLLAVIQSVDVNRTLDQESVRVMEKASPPKTMRKTVKVMALGVFAGLFLGFGLLYILNMFDDRFTTIAELRAQIAEYVVGQVPEVPVSKGHLSIELLHEDDDRHVFSESFRTIRSSLLYMFSGKQRPKTIIITSSVPAEGKSTVSTNLAVTLALAGSKVLLIDGDLRRCNVHKIFEMKGEPGFAEVLSQEIEFEKAIQETKVKNLHLLAAGDAQVNPGELFLTPSADLFLTRIYSKYDFILIDSAPVLATDDTTTLAPKLDGVLFVVRGDYTSSRMAREALGMLEQRNVNVLGVVFNRAMASRSGGYYYYQYSDYYSKGGKQTRKGASQAATDSPAPQKLG